MMESVLRFVVSCALLASPVMSATTGGQAQAGATRTVFASVVAKDGTPVTDLERFLIRCSTRRRRSLENTRENEAHVATPDGKTL